MMATIFAMLVSVIAVATALTLVDFWLRARSAYSSLTRQSKLVRAGFVPQVEAKVVRLRGINPRAGYGATRPFATRLPRPQAALHAPVAA